MCTLTFVPQENGYYLAMNRDERIARGVGTPPERFDLAGVSAVYPRDIEGGTWIGTNAQGTAFALLNWNDVPNKISKRQTRGAVIPRLLASATNIEAQKELQQLGLQGMLPFRLIGIFPAEKQIREWRWNQTSLSCCVHSWDKKNWFSSSLSDESASVKRGATCQNAWKQPDAASLSWLRRLHASHDATAAPFSICVHRESVETLSYTEFTCTPTQLVCNYFPGSPCRMAEPKLYVELTRDSGLVVGE